MGDFRGYFGGFGAIYKQTWGIWWGKGVKSGFDRF